MMARKKKNTRTYSQVIPTGPISRELQAFGVTAELENGAKIVLTLPDKSDLDQGNVINRLDVLMARLGYTPDE